MILDIWILSLYASWSSQLYVTIGVPGHQYYFLRFYSEHIRFASILLEIYVDICYTQLTVW
jgi:hypothetical protein